jgi:UDPglucose 6-dehydrogenase
MRGNALVDLRNIYDKAEAVADGADVLVIVTEWDEFRALDLGDLAKRMRGRMLVDLRNIYDKAEANEAGLDYQGIGRGRI